jgi:hypothetical protein
VSAASAAQAANTIPELLGPKTSFAVVEMLLGAGLLTDADLAQLRYEILAPEVSVMHWKRRPRLPAERGQPRVEGLGAKPRSSKSNLGQIA